ncbi:MarR family winged helix-turn-helix transcriptional regulator [Actinoallomurus acaciae]|uniref:MarR family winged helix-turn-helix transcriptional regulator n=1 Tax=Actinoallomurus acaciae TaxID=502577 RepID=A0ABV5Y7P7_9ACTN
MSEGDRRDAMDVIIDQWRRERPDLDLSAMGVFGRLVQVAAMLGPASEAVFARHGLRRGEFDVLAALRRSGPPYTLTPSEMAAELMMSRAGMTSRIDRLEVAGLVERSLDPDDRRSFRITLTGKGLRAVDAALGEHAARLSVLSSRLGDGESRALEDALRTLVRTLVD